MSESVRSGRGSFKSITSSAVRKQGFPQEELISLPSDLPLLRTLQKELSQPTASKGTRSLDKAPTHLSHLDPRRQSGLPRWGSRLAARSPLQHCRCCARDRSAPSPSGSMT